MESRKKRRRREVGGSCHGGEAVVEPGEMGDGLTEEKRKANMRSGVPRMSCHEVVNQTFTLCDTRVQNEGRAPLCGE